MELPITEFSKRGLLTILGVFLVWTNWIDQKKNITTASKRVKNSTDIKNTLSQKILTWQSIDSCIVQWNCGEVNNLEKFSMIFRQINTFDKNIPQKVKTLAIWAFFVKNAFENRKSYRKSAVKTWCTFVWGTKILARKSPNSSIELWAKYWKVSFERALHP